MSFPSPTSHSSVPWTRTTSTLDSSTTSNEGMPYTNLIPRENMTSFASEMLATSVAARFIGVSISSAQKMILSMILEYQRALSHALFGHDASIVGHQRRRGHCTLLTYANAGPLLMCQGEIAFIFLLDFHLTIFCLFQSFHQGWSYG